MSANQQKAMPHIHTGKHNQCPDGDKESCEFLHLHPDKVARLRVGLLREGELQRLGDFFKVLGDPSRLRLLGALQEEELCVCDLAAVLSMSQSAVSHQLRVLKQARLVKSRREGKTVFYSLDDLHVQSILQGGLEHIRE